MRILKWPSGVKREDKIRYECVRDSVGEAIRSMMKLTKVDRNGGRVGLMERGRTEAMRVTKETARENGYRGVVHGGT